VFQIDIKSIDHDQLTLSGRVLEQSDLEALTTTISKWYKNLQVDTAGIDVLRQPGNAFMTVATNLTSTHTSPSFMAEMSSQMVYGEEVEILSEQSRWVFTRQMNGYLAYTYKPYLTDQHIPEPTHIVTTPVSEVRAEAGLDAAILTRIFGGTKVKVLATKQDWVEVAGSATGWLRSYDLRALDALPQTPNARRAQLVQDAKKMIGVPYLWGGASSNGIDCSGLAQLLHTWVGIEIPRDADMQSTQSKSVEPPFQPGDLLFFGEGDDDRHITHVGVSLGGWEMIHSSRSRNGIYIDNVQEKDSLRSIFAHAGTFLK
jgi:cell wall-associated NlpC family hydrolase